MKKCPSCRCTTNYFLFWPTAVRRERRSSTNHIVLCNRSWCQETLEYIWILSRLLRHYDGEKNLTCRTTSKAVLFYFIVSVASSRTRLLSRCYKSCRRSELAFWPCRFELGIPTSNLIFVRLERVSSDESRLMYFRVTSRLHQVFSRPAGLDLRCIVSWMWEREDEDEDSPRARSRLATRILAGWMGFWDLVCSGAMPCQDASPSTTVAVGLQERERRWFVNIHYIWTKKRVEKGGKR